MTLLCTIFLYWLCPVGKCVQCITQNSRSMGPQVTAAILNFILLQKSSSPLQSVYFILFFSGRILICLGKNFKVIVHCCKKCGWWIMHNAYSFYIHYGCWLLRPWIRAVSFGFQTITFIFSLHAFLFNSSTIVFLTNNWRIYIQHLIQNVSTFITKMQWFLVKSNFTFSLFGSV